MPHEFLKFLHALYTRTGGDSIMFTTRDTAVDWESVMLWIFNPYKINPNVSSYSVTKTNLFTKDCLKIFTEKSQFTSIIVNF